MSKFRGPAKWRGDEPKRSNTGSSIRGKPISNPILVTEDDEFPIRTPGTSIATPGGAEGVEKELHLRASAIVRPNSKVNSQNIPSSDLAEASIANPTASETPPEPSYAPPSPPQVQQAPVRSSTASKPSGSSEGKPQRKKSSLRSVFGRLFGKKQKISPSTSPQIPERSNLRVGQHRSDPTALNRTAKFSPQRSASLPINEFNRALRSHSIVTEDFPLTDSIEVTRGSIQVEGQTRPRRATTPSRLWTPNIAPKYVDWSGLSPRPASSHARGSKVFTDEDIAPYIGVAVTSGSHPNRRSRSVGELRETSTKVSARRRSDEIRYWRESYDPGVLSPMSSNKAEAEEPILMDETEEAHDGDPENVPEPFNFGPMGEMAGMKITQAANLETRILRLEKRMREMERAVSRIHNWTSTDALTPQDLPKRSSLRNRSTSGPRPKTDESEISLPRQQRHRGVERVHVQESRPAGSHLRSSSYESSRPSTTSTSNSNHPSIENPLPPFEELDFSSSRSTARPLSTSTTIRGIPSSSPTIAKHGNLTGEHYTTLINMILAEQAARQNLEAIVHNLQQQLKSLRSSSAASYPTPGSEHPAQLKGNNGAGREFSSFEQDDSSDDEGRYEREDFQTPNEENAQFGDEIFGESDYNKESHSAPRTLSLSQMTLRRDVQPSLNF